MPTSSPQPPAKSLPPLLFYAWALVVGIIGALGAVTFRALIAVFHNLLFLGRFSFHYDANVHTPPSPFGALIIIAPVAAAAVVAFLVSHFAPEAKGHGVPEVMDAIYYKKGIIRPTIALIKSVASALSIGSGGSVGREGPIIQIGASFGATLGKILHVPVHQRITLIAAGAAAGIAATFNTPIGGVLFAIEIMLHEVSARTLVPVTIATVTASYVGRLMLGDHPSFLIPALEVHATHATNFVVLLFYPALGVIMGLVSVLFIRALYATEDFFQNHVPGHYTTRHMLGMLAVGITMYLLVITTGHYSVQGVGYATVQDILTGQVAWFLLVLFALKLLVTCLTLGSGASGGVFSPALFLGATIGGVYGLALHTLLPSLPIYPAAFALAGMAGAVGGSTGAALAAVVMVFEMTLDYTVIIPMTITVALSYGIRTLLCPQSIYTEKLARRGHYIPTALQANFYPLQKARSIMNTHFATLAAGDSPNVLHREEFQKPDLACFIIRDDKRIVGFLTPEAARTAQASHDDSKTLADLADTHFVTVSSNVSLLQAMTALQNANAAIAILLDKKAAKAQPAGSLAPIAGFLPKEKIADAMIDTLGLFTP